MRNAQLADLLRPKSFDDIVGQEHLFGERGVVRRMVNSGRVTNMIFFGLTRYSISTESSSSRCSNISRTEG